MIIFLIFLQVVKLIVADPTCPDGFTVWNDVACVKLFDEPLLYQDALQFCKAFTGGNLLSIHNAIDNRALVNIAVAQGYTHPLWLGLTCTDTDAEYTMCTWEDESGYTTSYSNFANSYPSTDVGNNIYMLTTGGSVGKWVSSDGTVQTLGYFCGIPTYGDKMFCPNNFNGYCYTLNLKTPYLDAAGAREYCQKEFCGDLASIHSDFENMFVNSLFPFMSYWDQIRIGAASNGSDSYWLDGTPFDYPNYGYCNSDIGICSSYSIYRDVIPPYQWMSSPCQDKIPFVCKRADSVQSCGPATVSPITPAPGNATGICGIVPTMVPDNPQMCYQSQFYTGIGTIYSPFYPNNYSPIYSGPCTYVITVPHGSIAQVKFTSETYIKRSKMLFYSQLEDGKPFANFTGYPPTYSFNSTTNVIKMVFTVFGEDHVPEEKWVAKFGYDDDFPNN